MTRPPAGRARRLLRARPLLLDLLIAVAVLAVILTAAVTVAHRPDGVPGFGERELPAHTAALAVLICAALVVRRRFPMAVLAAVCALAVADLALSAATREPQERHVALAVGVVVALFTVAGRTGRPTTWRVGLVTVTVVTGAVMLLGPRPWYAGDNLSVFAWVALAAVAGEAVRSRRAAMDAVRERAERAERTREEEARRRVAEERMRIARELHDVVAHHIALVNVQAGVASHVMDTRPDQAKEALAHVREASRQALGELQATVGLLRHRDDPVAPKEPARGLAVLDDLVDGFVRAGMEVTVRREGPGGPLPAAVDLAAYRVVQEALTNVHKHAGPGARARVGIRRSPGPGREGEGGAVEITVHDDGRGPGTAAPGTGHGLVGMCERAEALGGSCRTGPGPEGGFQVRVVLPLGQPTARRDAGRGCGR